MASGVTGWADIQVQISGAWAAASSARACSRLRGSSRMCLPESVTGPRSLMDRCTLPYPSLKGGELHSYASLTEGELASHCTLPYPSLEGGGQCD